jgi:hypothetical protein
MKCVVEIGSGAMIYIPSFIKLIGGDSQTHKEHGKPFFLFQNEES